MAWADKYRPVDISELIMPSDELNSIIRWADSWRNNEVIKKSLILYGDPGTGKTTTATVIANYLNVPLIEMNASDERNADSMKRVALMSSLYSDLLSERRIPDRLILIDEADNIFESRDPKRGGDYGGITELLNVVKETRNPVIITMNDYYSFRSKRSGREIIDNSLVIEMRPYRRRNDQRYREFINKCLERCHYILKKEGKSLPENDIIRIIKENEPDIRSIINDLEAYAQDSNPGTRNKKIDIYRYVIDTFHSHDYDKLINSFSDADFDPDYYIKWIDQNLKEEYQDPEDLKNAYDILSIADLYSRLSYRANYMLTGISQEIAAGVSLMVKNKNRSTGRYSMPDIIKMYSSRKGINGARTLLEKLAALNHTSSNVIVSYLWFYRIIKRTAEFKRISRILDLSDNEVKQI
ncbi:replication factor C large subunit [Picrophilus oshimae]|uniref:Replication factor C large subunit n=1 Tax=Picrophilus torridus (strain ATCC 700027 / DSM 9790 / JCM 10055 / NBRC 100828 / KAW 2/3) TaxID=1122961 RepID=RFCL_PICTO|nr:replication factor C large subunit [Picrophilus oshimae]Q6L0P4.1 RecName: Full=Replication factor C large subunit; Short=RFC large subunit; AltName: Full=Clamp loader large subunit [Picrophilus oshimae DSM 9789]AAT43458.1 replication factor C, large subunit [Picrophilus oshimae DSM 9789]